MKNTVFNQNHLIALKNEISSEKQSKEMKELQELIDLLMLYEAALKIVNTKIEILNKNYEMTYHNPIEHIKTRIKKPQSIYEKMVKKRKSNFYKRY